jgi:hypothetical protein
MLRMVRFPITFAWSLSSNSKLVLLKVIKGLRLAERADVDV